MNRVATWRPPRQRARVSLPWLAVAAAVSVAAALAVEALTQPVVHPRYPEMLAAARETFE